jgi:starch phosphorylase
MREAANVPLGFVRRFAGYKRPNLLLENLARQSRLLNDPARPFHLVLAGKAHPADSEGKKMIRDWRSRGSSILIQPL